MGNKCSQCFSSSIGGGRDPIVDVEKLLVDYAWNELARTTWLDQRLKSRRFDIRLNSSYINIDHKVAVLDYLEKPDVESEDVVSQSTKSQLVRDQAKKLTKTGRENLEEKLPQRNLHLFKTCFENSTGKTQKFSFKTDKQTKAVMNVSVQKGFQLNGKLDLKLQIPKVGSITGGIGAQRQLTEIEGETYEETESWGIDTQIEVDEGKRCHAAVIVCQERMDANFTVESSIHCNQDIPVYVTNKKTKEKHILLIPAENLHYILSADKGFTIVAKNHVTIKSKGTYRATYGAQQKISVEYEDLPTKPDQRESTEEQAKPGTSTESAASVQIEASVETEKPMKEAADGRDEKQDGENSDDEKDTENGESVPLVAMPKSQ